MVVKRCGRMHLNFGAKSAFGPREARMVWGMVEVMEVEVEVEVDVTMMIKPH